MDSELQHALDISWRLMIRGAADRRSPMHTPVVASVTADGRPDSRIIVLRAVDRSQATLRFHTDARSPKCRDIDGRPVSVLAYHPGEAVQLRIAGVGRVLADDPAADAVWAQSPPFARRCYLAEQRPGTPLSAPASGLPEWVQGREPTLLELAPARANFAVLMVDITAIDWLHLAQAGHRRAVFCAAHGWNGEWRVP